MIDCRFRRAAVLSRATPGHLVVCSLGGRSLELAGSAVEVWRALPAPGADPIELRTAAAQLAAEFGLAVEVAERDTVAVVAALESVDCVERID